MLHPASKKAIVLIAVAGLLAACSSNGSTSAKSSSSPRAISLKAGLNDPRDTTVALLAFLPSKITVQAGTSVTWTANGPEPHTVTFMANNGQAPAAGSAAALQLQAPKPPTGEYDGSTTISSGLGPTGTQPMKFSVTFSKPGTYQYHCIIHPGMVGTVTVTSDASSADSQSAVDGRANSEQSQYISEGEAAKKAFLEKPLRKTTANGHTTWYVEMGTSTEHTTVLAFQPVTADVKKGDKVVFINNSGLPHTATFGTPPTGKTPDELMAPIPGRGPLTLRTGTLLSSGWLPPNAPPGSGPPESARTFTFDVTSAGSFQYICLLHKPSGMAGVIVAS